MTGRLIRTMHIMLEMYSGCLPSVLFLTINFLIILALPLIKTNNAAHPHSKIKALVYMGEYHLKRIVLRRHFTIIHTNSLVWQKVFSTASAEE